MHDTVTTMNSPMTCPSRVEELEEAEEVEAQQEEEVEDFVPPLPPKDGWTQPTDHQQRGGRGLIRRASVFFFGHAKSVPEDPPPEPVDHYHDNILAGFATTSNRGSWERGELQAEDSPQSSSSFLNGLTSISNFQYGLRTVNFCVILLLLCFFLPAHLLKYDAGIYLDLSDPNVQFDFVATISSIVPLWIFMPWAAQRVIPPKKLKHNTTKNINNRSGGGLFAAICNVKIPKPGRTGFLMLLCVTIEVLDQIAREMVREEHHSTTFFLIDRALAFTLFAFWTSALDDGVAQVHRFADKSEAIVNASPDTPKWKKFMFGMSKFRNEQIDKAYSIPGGSRSPARVLAEVIGVYCTIGKCAGFFFLFLFLIGVDLYSSLVTFGLSALFLSVISSLHINDALSNLLPLAISNAIHVGEIISLAAAGHAAEDPGEVLTGFVEGLTWSHVVIRDFKRKQVFVPHQEMTKMSVYNWSRRPGKTLSVTLRISITHGGGVARVGTLCKFAVQWLKDHPKIDNKMYMNCKMKVDDKGQAKLIVICYPTMDAKKRVVEGEITCMLLEACKRLNLCLIPTLHRPADLWESTTAARATAEEKEEKEAASTTNEHQTDERNKNEDDDEAATTETEELSFTSENQAYLDLLSDLKPSEKLTAMTGLAKNKVNKKKLL